MSSKLDELKAKLREMFQMDQAELDFGIYRIMNTRRDEIDRFLDRDLLPQIRVALSEFEPDGLRKAKADWADIQKAPTRFAPEYKDEVRLKVEQGLDLGRLEEEIYSHLLAFFSRYYHEGDFLSRRVYKEGVYALPYEGEEVKLHWANADQYYIKSTENFRTYAFHLADKRRVRFELVAASTEQDNRKAAADKERRFILHAEAPVELDKDELVIRFEYRPDDEKRKQAVLNDEAVAIILGLSAVKGVGDWSRWHDGLASVWRPRDQGAASTKLKDRSVLEKHLTDYTAKNSFDYFIHKDLGRFLRRELDFFIKNEIMMLDDIENDSPVRVEHYLGKLRALRRIAHKIIDFLAQLENFQKKLWLKKKFVLETQWLVTLDRVPEKFYAEIVANDRQRAAWVELFAIDQIQGDLAGSVAYGAPLSVEFLKANPFLVLDTAFFPHEFKERLLAEFDDIDGDSTGLLVNADNFQAMNLLEGTLQSKIKSIYIDPPYNTDAEPINYKNGYKSSSWLSLIADRLKYAKRFLRPDGVLCITIDDFQFKELGLLIENIFGKELVAGVVAIRSNPSGRPTPSGFGQAHEYGIFVKASEEADIGRLERSDEQSKRYGQVDDCGHKFMWELFRKRGSGSERADRPTLYYPIYVNGSQVRIPAMEWDAQSRNWAATEDPRLGEEVVWPIDEKGTQRRWRGKPDSINKRPADYQFTKGNVYYKFRPSEGVVPTTAWIDARYSATEHGTGALKSMFKGYNIFSYPKSIFAVEDSLRLAGLEDDEDVALDFFAGSGTTANAVINMNRRDNGNRRFVLVEMGDYFDTVLRERIQKCAYSKEWKDGEPVDRSGVSQLIKYIRLESYEDTLDNLELARTESQRVTLMTEGSERLREDYLLRYMLDVESQASLLNPKWFERPSKMGLAITRNDDTRTVDVDLVETFNYLLGLRVRSMRRLRGVYEVVGTDPSGDRVLILWRDLGEVGNGALETWFERQQYNSRDMEFDLIYINGDNTIENLRRPDQSWKVRLIEEAFHELMFAEEN